MKNTGTHICPHCGTHGWPQTISSIPDIVEGLAWIFFFLLAALFSWWLLIIPFVISVIRSAKSIRGCDTCKQPGMIPLNSPNGQRLAAHFAESPRQNGRQNS
jgi:hypothetical protein